MRGFFYYRASHKARLVGGEYEMLHQVFETGAAPTFASDRRVELALHVGLFIDELGEKMNDA